MILKYQVFLLIQDIIWKQIAIAAKDTLTTGIIKNGKNKIGFKMTGIPTAKPQLELNITGSKLALAILSSSLDLLLVINTITINAKNILAPPIVAYG